MNKKSSIWRKLKSINKQTKINYQKSTIKDIEKEITKNLISDVLQKRKKKFQINQEITGALDINNNLIKRNSKAFKNFLKLGYKVVNRKMTPPKTNKRIPYTGNLSNLMKALKKSYKTVIINVDDDNYIKQFQIPATNFKAGFKRLLREIYAGQIIDFILLKSSSNNFGPMYDGKINCLIKLIEDHTKANKIKFDNNLYNEFKDGVFEADIPELAKRVKFQINIRTDNKTLTYNNTKKYKQLNVFYQNNHAYLDKKIELSKNYIKEDLNDYMENNISYKDIQNIILDKDNIIFVKTNTATYQRKYSNNIDLEKEECITENQFYLKHCFKYFTNKPSNINANDLNIETIKQIRHITLNFSKEFNTNDTAIVDINNAYNKFGILPTDLSYFYDAINMTDDEHNILIEKEGFGLIDDIQIQDITIGGWRGLNMIRHLKKNYDIKIKQYMISSNTTTFKIDEFMKFKFHSKRKWHKILGKFQSITKIKSTYTTDPIIGGVCKFQNEQHALFENIDIQDYIGNNFYPHIVGYIHEYTNIKMLDKYLQLKKANIKVYRGWVDGLYFDKTKKYLVQNNKNWKFENTEHKPEQFDEVIQKINNIPLSHFSTTINITNDKFTAYIGGAGYGKSYILKEIYKQNPSNTLILTPTRLLKKSYQPFNVHTYQKFITPQKISNFNKYNILLIDEYTMITPSDFDKILQIATNLTHCYIFGDTAQLINTDDITIDLTNFKVIELKKNHRQICPEFQKNINITRKTGDISYIKQYITVADAIKSKKIILTPTNYEIERINKIGLELNTNELKHGWKKDTPIIFIEQRKDFCNGETGIIINIDTHLHIQKQDNTIIKLKPEQSNLINLYYSTTYHKFQGQTIKDEDLVINLNTIEKFNKNNRIRMTYVGASRVKNIKQLYILI